VGSPVLVRHDHGCKYARLEGGGHSDAAKRLADWYNLHRAAGTRRGVIAVALADGSSDGVLYEDRAAAVCHQHHNERWYAFIRIAAPSMSICEAESVMRWQRQAAAIAPPQRDEPGGGREVIPRLTAEDCERQLAAMTGRVNLPVALGKSKEQ